MRGFKKSTRKSKQRLGFPIDAFTVEGVERSKGMRLDLGTDGGVEEKISEFYTELQTINGY